MTSVPDIDSLFDNMLAGDRGALGKAITIVESYNPAHRELAGQLLDRCLRLERNTFRFAISGPPGAGKSTLIEALGSAIIAGGENLAVLAIDPSSQVAKGSILGDKTRMPELSRSEHVYIRPTPARAALGGVAESTRESIALCEAAGYKNICIETVGVGQSEADARNMVDCFILVLNPGSGDELQGIKKGIVELADGILVNKADGPTEKVAAETARHYERALHMLAARPHGEKIFVYTCSARERTGISEFWAAMSNFHSAISLSGYKQNTRAEQDLDWLEKLTMSYLRQMVMRDSRYTALYEGVRHQIAQRQLSVTTGFARLRQLINEIVAE